MNTLTEKMNKFYCEIAKCLMHGLLSLLYVLTQIRSNLFHCGGKNKAVSANLLNFPLQMQHLDCAGQFGVLVPRRLSKIALPFKKVKFN